MGVYHEVATFIGFAFQLTDGTDTNYLREKLKDFLIKKEFMSINL